MNTHQKANTATGSAQEGATVRYTAKTHTSGGRRGGVSSSDDGRLDVKFSAPGVPGTGTDPEQLFAAEWSACFISAMGVVARRMKVTLPTDVAVDAEIDLCNSGDVYFLRARLNVSVPGWSVKSPKSLWTRRTARHVPIPTLHGATSRLRSTWCKAGAAPRRPPESPN